MTGLISWGIYMSDDEEIMPDVPSVETPDNGPVSGVEDPEPVEEDPAPVEPVEAVEEEPGEDQDPEIEDEIEDPGDEQSDGFSSLIPSTLVDSIRAEVQSHGTELLQQHKDLVQGLVSQVSGHANTIKEMQGHMETLRDMKTNPQSAFLKTGYQILQDQDRS